MIDFSLSDVFVWFIILVVIGCGLGIGIKAAHNLFPDN